MSSTNKTQNLQLNQWVGTDPVIMSDFNADNAKIDAAVQANAEAIAAAKQEAASALAEAMASGVKIHTGTYTGNDKYGANKTTITFPFQPKLVFISRQSGGDCSGPLINGCSSGLVFLGGTYANSLGLTWSGNTLSIQSNSNSQQQLNINNTKYHYVAFG